jgi:outer membrane protein
MSNAKSFKSFKYAYRFAGTFLTALYLSSAALAATSNTGGTQQSSYDPYYMSATQKGIPTGMDQAPAEDRKSDWQATLGAGLAIAPAYEGSTHYTPSPIPLVAISWRDTVSLGIDGLLVYHKAGDFRYGAGVTFDPGRKDDGKNFFGVSSGDHRLKGLGNVDAAAGFKAFGSYDAHLFNNAPPLVLDASVVKLTASNNDGILIKSGVSMPYQLGQSWRLTPKAEMVWADDNYMKDYFGVSSEQAANSQFSTYKAQAGIKDASVGVNATYAINKNWFVSNEVSVKQLFGDAASSPISATNTSVSFVSLIGYHF